MRLNKNNNNINSVDSSSLFLSKENITIFLFLILFTAISMILISFCFDTLLDSFSQLQGEDSLLREGNICSMSPEVTSCLSIKRDSSKNGLNIFNSFIDLFNKSHSSYRYFPSYFQIFMNNNSFILSNKAITLLSIDENKVDPQNLVIAKEVISYNQYLVLEHYNKSLNDLLNDLCKIVLEYRQSNSL
jgi:hypothetical protein